MALGDVADVTTARVDGRVLVIVSVPVAEGLDPDWTEEALQSAVSRASSIAGAAARTILMMHHHDLDKRSDD